MDRSLLLDDNSRLEWLDKDYKLFLNRNTIVYGMTGSGKTCIIDELMYLCKSHVSSCCVVCPTNAEHKSYDGKVPSCFIQPTLDPDWVDSLIKRQKTNCDAFNQANDPKFLHHIYSKIATDNQKLIELKIKKITRTHLAFIECSEAPFPKKKKQISAIKNKCEKGLLKLYKKVIRSKKAELETSSNLSDLEKGKIKFLDFNPNILVIFDDCAADFKKACKKTNAFKQIFYQGRHLKITGVFAMQSDKECDSELRKNAFVNIFTTSQAATENFNRASNAYPKHEKIRSRYLIKSVFTQEKTEPVHYQKLVYLQNTMDPFRYTIADIYDDFRVGDEYTWKLNNEINKQKKSLQKHNPLFLKYA
jgi:hypothetical protein